MRLGGLLNNMGHVSSVPRIVGERARENRASHFFEQAARGRFQNSAACQHIAIEP
jgi:hypothetical protein